MRQQEAKDKMEEIIRKDLTGNNSITLEFDHDDSILIYDREGPTSSGQGMLMSSTFQKIFVKTGYFMTAITTGLTEGQHYVMAYMSNKDRLDSVTKDGEYWEDSKYRAKCPKCGETEAFNLMRFNPSDYRDSTCPKCGDTHRVRAMYTLDKGEVF